MLNTMTDTSTTLRIRDHAGRHGWTIEWDNRWQLCIVRDDRIVHVELTESGRVRWAELATAFNGSRNISIVNQVAVPRDSGKLATVLTWMGLNQ